MVKPSVIDFTIYNFLPTISVLEIEMSFSKK